MFVQTYKYSHTHTHTTTHARTITKCEWVLPDNRNNLDIVSATSAAYRHTQNNPINTHTHTHTRTHRHTLTQSESMKMTGGDKHTRRRKR